MTIKWIIPADFSARIEAGELVVVVGPPGKGQADAERMQAELDTLLHAALDSMRLKEAVAQVTAQTGLPRKQVYARALALAEDK